MIRRPSEAMQSALQIRCESIADFHMTMEEVMQSLLELNEVRPGLYKRINEAICKLL